jgi:hypothetical protein
MKAYRWLALISGVLISVLAALVPASASEPATDAPPATCAMRLGVVLTPDIPNPADPGFLSSLLSNHSSYQLTLQRAEPHSVLVLELYGPGPESSCQNVIETMRRDARVLAVDVERELPYATTAPTAGTISLSDDAPTTSDDAPSVSIVTASWQPEAATPHVSLAGLGSLYWGAAHPAQAWKTLAPLQSDDAAYADIRASCAASAAALTSAAPCP